MNTAAKDAEKIKMKRVWDICCDPEFKACLEELRTFEKDRIFCGHDIDHLLTVARLAYIFSLEREYGLDKSLIYAAAMLHDCGRALEYREGIPHDQGGAEIAGRILAKYDFSEEEVEMITAAIKSHRGKESTPREDMLSEILYDADKMSRDCFACRAQEECSWGKKKKNLSIMW